MRRVLPFLALLAVSTPAPAQTVDEAGANRIAENLSRYIGSTAFGKGVLDVSVDGDAYRLAIDFDAIAAMVPGTAELSLDLDTFVLRLKPQADGTFAVSGDLSPDGSIGFRVPETEQSPSMRSQFEWSLEESELTGIFDPELATFSSAAGSFRGLTAVSRDDNQQADITVGSGTFEMTAATSAGEGIDYDSTQTMIDFAETVTVPAAPDGPSVPITVTSPKITAESSATGLQLKPILEILAFGVAHADKDEIAADQPELKRLILAALPLWGTISGGYDVSDLDVDTPVGQFRFSNVEFAVAIDGISESGSLDYDLEFAGITIPPGLAPEWSAPLLPTEVSLNFGVRNLNSEGPVRQFVEALDLDREPPIPEAVEQEVIAEFLANPPIFVMDRSVIRNADIEITMSAEMPYPLDKPSMSATVEVAGFEKAASALQAAAAVDPTAQEALPFVLAARGLGKMLEDGRLQWIVGLRSDGALLVNGAMLKGPDPFEVPLPEQ
jgi:hypothetical protein